MREIVKEHCGMSENKAKETQVYTGIDVFKLCRITIHVLQLNN